MLEVRSINPAAFCQLWLASSQQFTIQIIMWTPPLSYLEVLDQFLDLPVLGGQVCVALWTALRLLLLLLTLGRTLAENVPWHASRRGLTETQKRAGENE